MAPPTSRLPAPGRPALERERPTSMYEVPADQMRRLQQLGSGRQSPAEGLTSGEDGVSAKQSKRRSLLPQSFTRKFSGEGKEVAASITEDTTASESGRKSEDRAAMPPPPKARPTSMMRPPNSIARKDSIARKEAPGHNRLPSKEGVTPPARSSSIAKPLSTTPNEGQSGIRRGNSTKMLQSPVTRTPGHSAPSTRSTNRGSVDLGTALAAPKRSPPSTAQKRSSVSLAKPLVLNTALPPSTQTQPSPTSPTRLSARSRMAAPSKPAFNTYQQHYSPAKSVLPKPGIPSARTAAKPASASEDAENMPFDVALEQIELLQLSLMHQASFSTVRAYEASARQKLGKMHAKLQKEYQSIQRQEQSNRRAANLDALEAWCPDAPLLAEHLQTLGRVVTDLRAHTELGSRYSELVHVFDEWASKAEDVLTSRETSAKFIEALPESWRSQHTSLALNLRSIQRELSVLPPLPPPADSSADPPSLHVMLESCSSLAEGMVRELEMMTKLQKEVLQQGKSRIDQQISTLVADGDMAQQKENWKPAWQSVGS